MREPTFWGHNMTENEHTNPSAIDDMAKPVTQKIKLLSSAGTGYYYVTKKNPRNLTEKLALKKYDPVVKKHVEFKEAKIK